MKFSTLGFFHQTIEPWFMCKDFDDFRLDFLGELEATFKTALVRESGP
jgi:hypothetical protein